MTRTNLEHGVRTYALALGLLAWAGGVARADTDAEDHLARAKEAHARGDFAQARDELLAAYQIEPRPALLFALGQVELNLGHYQQAIDYYERFKATSPPADQLALAEQAIGAARIELERPSKPNPTSSTTSPAQPLSSPTPKLPPHRQWDVVDEVIAATGGAVLIGGGIALAVGLHLPSESNSTLHTYDARVNDAYIARDLGVGGVAVSGLALGSALLRWRFHLVDSTVGVEATRGGVALQVGGTL